MVRAAKKFGSLKSNRLLFSKLGENLRKLGIDDLYIILSYDCDTPLDSAASVIIKDYLASHGIPAVFAVPGVVIEKNKKTYKSIYDQGFEFINHGYLEHAAYDHIVDSYYSVTWYHKMAEDDVRNDIIKGHNTLWQTLGCASSGFRAPHFGYFQDPAQLEIIYSEINKLNYKFASTTMPSMAIKNGYVYKTAYGLYEFPVTGTYDVPSVILDSWQFFAAPERKYTENDYKIEFKKLLKFYSDNKLPGILNLYADPSHIVDSNTYFDCIEYALQKGAVFITYLDMLNKIKNG